MTVPAFPSAASSFTVAVWLRLSAAQLATDSQPWVAILSNEIFRQGGWQLNIDNRLGRPRMDFAYWAPPLDDYLFVECECLEVDRWFHVAAVVDLAVNRVTLHTDGVVGDQETRPSDIEQGDSTLYSAAGLRTGACSAAISTTSRFGTERSPPPKSASFNNARRRVIGSRSVR